MSQPNNRFRLTKITPEIIRVIVHSRLLNILMIFLAIPSLGNAQYIDSGYRETVIDPHFPEAPPGIARTGIPRVAFTPDGTAHILCPHRDGVRYFRSTHTGTTYEDISNQRPHMVECYIGIGPGGEIVAAYGQSGGVKFARNDGTGWITQDVPTTRYQGTQLSGAVSQNGAIALLVTEKIIGVEMRLSLYRHPGDTTGTWSRISVSSTVEGDGNFAQAHEMVYDKSVNLHIVYQTGWSMDPDIGGNHIKLSPDGTLTERTFAQKNNFGDFKLILDDQEQPHVLYLGYNSYVYHASFSDSSWNTVPITVPPGNIMQQQLGALGLLRDSSGQIIPAIARNGICHVRWTGTEFSYSPIDANSSTSGGSLVGFDPDGYPVYLWIRDYNGGINASEPVTMGIVRNTRVVEPQLKIGQTGNSINLSSENLLPGESYQLSRSDELDSWDSDPLFMAEEVSWSRTEPLSATGRGFFSLNWLHSSTQNAQPFE